GGGEDGPQPRQVDGGDLVLQGLGAGADDDLPAGEQGGDQIGQRLAGAGPGLDQEALVAVDGVGDPFGHRQLAGARLVAGEDLGRGAARSQQEPDVPSKIAADRVARRRRSARHFWRLAFSSRPEIPNRLRSWANTASSGTPADSRPTRAWKIRSAASWAVWAGSFWGSASMSSPDSSAIFPLILGSPASSSDTTYDFSGR